MSAINVGDSVLWLRTMGGGGGSGRAPSAKDPLKATVVQFGKDRVRIAVGSRKAHINHTYHVQGFNGTEWYDMAAPMTLDDAIAHLADYNKLYPTERHRITGQDLTWVKRASIATGKDDDIFQCQDCQRIWHEDQLCEARHLWERVAPGEEMPGGECPICHALCALWRPYVDEVCNLVSRMHAFDKKCAREEYTELDDIWELFNEAKKMLQGFQRQPGFATPMNQARAS